MTYSYTQRKPDRRPEAAKQKPSSGAVPGSLLTAAAALPASDQPGPPTGLSGAIREKFENAFGADLSAVRLYQSQAVADFGARAVAQGNRIAFAPGLLDFTSRAGQTLLGHELSHVVSQQRGEVTGSGFLNSPALEARADREGAMAAAGQQISMPAAALSSASAGSAAGPMQAKKDDVDTLANTYSNIAPMPADSQLAPDPNTGMPPAVQNPYQNSGDAAIMPGKKMKRLGSVDKWTKPIYGAAGTVTKSLNSYFADNDLDKLDHGIFGEAPVLKGTLGVMGLLSGGFTAVNSGASMVRNWRNAKAGGSKLDAAEDALQGLAGVSTFGSGASSLASFVNPAAKLGSWNVGGLAEGFSKWLPGLSIATGGLNALAGLSQSIRGGKRWWNTSKQYDAVNQGSYVGRENNRIQLRNTQNNTNIPLMTGDDQEKMKRTIRHGKEIQKRNTFLGLGKLISGGLTAAGGAVALGGPTAPAGFLLGALGAGVGAITSGYNLWKNRRLRRDALAEELGGKSYKATLADVKAQLKGSGPGLTDKYISDRKAWKIFLKSHNVADTKKAEEAQYAEIRKRRAAHMLQMAQNGNAEADAFISSMGVNKVKVGNTTDYAEGALDLLAAKMR